MTSNVEFRTRYFSLSFSRRILLVRFPLVAGKQMRHCCSSDYSSYLTHAIFGQSFHCSPALNHSELVFSPLQLLSRVDTNFSAITALR